MNRFSFYHLLILFLNSAFGRLEEETHYDESENQHVVTIGTGMFSSHGFFLSDEAAKTVGLNSPTDVVNLDTMDQKELVKAFANFYPVIVDREGEPGQFKFVIVTEAEAAQATAVDVNHLLEMAELNAGEDNE